MSDHSDERKLKAYDSSLSIGKNKQGQKVVQRTGQKGKYNIMPVGDNHGDKLVSEMKARKYPDNYFPGLANRLETKENAAEESRQRTVDDMSFQVAKEGWNDWQGREVFGFSKETPYFSWEEFRKWRSTQTS